MHAFQWYYDWWWLEIDDVYGDDDDDEDKDKEDDEPEWLQEERETFKNTLDKDKDGQLNRQEVIDWVIPEYYESIETETRHLISQADGDKVCLVGNSRNTTSVLRLLIWVTVTYRFSGLCFSSVCKGILQTRHMGNVFANQKHTYIYVCYS